MNNINLKTAAQSVLPDTGTVQVVFTDTQKQFKDFEGDNRSYKQYTYLAQLDLIKQLEYGDHVVVMANGEPKVARVVYTRTNTDELDLNSEWEHQWALSRVPMELKDALYERDRDCHKRLKVRQQRVLRDQVLREGIGLSHDELKLMIEDRRHGPSNNESQ